MIVSHQQTTPTIAVPVAVAVLLSSARLDDAADGHGPSVVLWATGPRTLQHGAPGWQ